jgi:hypothetical protein
MTYLEDIVIFASLNEPLVDYLVLLLDTEIL